ncbi:ABC transporter ATP-binding protein [Oceanobacillus sojae]|uniref:ABC transporter ATP-binding protein n=1 Tax=Oceanobacillus sojae TaxID=582851 RepID=UPI000988914B|nr:ABC transporter ATP-binding protein [Oceanobacillus sojae]
MKLSNTSTRIALFSKVAPLGKALSPVTKPLLGATLIELLSAVFAVLPYVLIVQVGNELLSPAPNAGLVWTLVLSAVACLVLHAALSMVALTVTHLTDGTHQWRLRRELVAKLGRLPLGWFSVNNAGQVKKMLQDDTHAIHYVIAHSVLDLVSGLAVPLLSFIYLFTVDWRLAIIALAPPLTYFIIFGVVTSRSSGVTRGIGEISGRLSGRVIEVLEGIQVIRAFGQTGKAHRRYSNTVDEYISRTVDWLLPLSKLQAAISVLLQPITFLLLILMVGTGFIATGRMEPLTILPFLLLALTMGNPVLRLGNGMSSLMEAMEAAKRLENMRGLSEIEEPMNPQTPDAGQLDVEYKNVVFSYKEGYRAVDHVSFVMLPGTITALVGPSGSGKSTIAKLLPRFYDPQSGSIAIGGVPIREMDTSELYRKVGFVFQDVRLLQETIRDNIRLGNPDASEEDVIRVARAARIHDRIERLPRGYDSIVGVDARLSGGEAQRISIARALLADAPIIVMDEATSMIDPESEAEIQHALTSLIKGRTVLVIAHRLHTIVGADQIHVVDDGNIVQRGTHEELISSDGLYSRLWKAYERTKEGRGKQ